MPNDIENTQETPVEHDPVEHDPVERLIRVLHREGFKSLDESEDAGERIYRRDEKVLFASGETVFHIIDFPKLDQKSQAKLLGHLQTQAAGASVAPSASVSTAPPKFKSYGEAARYYDAHPEEREAMANR